MQTICTVMDKGSTGHNAHILENTSSTQEVKLMGYPCFSVCLKRTLFIQHQWIL